jgi:hypothetical protein
MATEVRDRCDANYGTTHVWCSNWSDCMRIDMTGGVLMFCQRVLIRQPQLQRTGDVVNSCLHHVTDAQKQRRPECNTVTSLPNDKTTECLATKFLVKDEW